VADPQLHLPAYTGASIVNLMSSIQAAFGVGEPLYSPLAELSAERLASGNTVLFVVDGLGYQYLLQQDGSGALRRHLLTRLTSVFPTTTASAITTFLTGVAPQQHGLTGWFTYFKEIGSVVTPLPFRARYGGASLNAAGVDARQLFDRPSLFEKIDVRSHIVLPQRIVDSDYTLAYGGGAERHAYVSLRECFRCIADILHGSAARKYIYAYWPELDTLAHEHGIGSAQVAAHFAELDAAFADFFETISGNDATVLVTADHGFVDSAPSKLIRLQDHPELAETLLLPLCGEPRVAFCYVHPERCQQFEAYVRDRLAGSVVMMKSTDVIERRFFGLGTAHPRLCERVGHYTLLMKENHAIKDWVLGERPFVHVGVHGGLSEQEMYVPLIAYDA
jgi:predicted AlkP superfamily pyrophosphatase or phosphodiesterase